jgi:hypothetical protein
MQTTRPATIYDQLAAKLGRTPTHEETKSEVRRILADGTRERAEAGKLAHQRGRVR